MLDKTLEDWIDQMERDPASLVPMLCTQDGRKQLQVSSLASTTPNMLRLLQNKGHSLLEAIGIVSPLLLQIPIQEAVGALPLRTQPELLWYWWLANNDAVNEARNGWKNVAPERMAALGFQWAWTYALGVRTLKSNHEPLLALVNDFVCNMPRKPARALWELMHTLADSDAFLKKHSKHWHALAQEARVDLPLLTSMPCRAMPKGFASFFIEVAQHADAGSIEHFLQAHPDSIKLDMREKNLGDWTCPLGGFALLLGSNALDATSLKNHPDVTPLLAMFEAVGMDLTTPDNVKTARALVQSTYTTKRVRPDSMDVYALPDLD